MESLSDHDNSLIEGKLDGSLSDEELSAFEQKIKTSESFKKEFELNEVVVQSIIKNHKKDLKQELEGFLVDAKQAKFRSTLNIRLMVAASISILLLLSFAFFFFSQQNISSQDLYEAYFEVYPAPPVTRGSDAEQDSRYFEKYRKGDYSQSIEILNSSTNSAFTPLYLASCYLQIGDTENAIATLEVGISSDKLMVSQTSEWYLGLAHMKVGDSEKSKQILQKIVLEKQLFQHKAKEVLSQMSD